MCLVASGDPYEPTWLWDGPPRDPGPGDFQKNPDPTTLVIRYASSKDKKTRY